MYPGRKTQTLGRVLSNRVRPLPSGKETTSIAECGGEDWAHTDRGLRRGLGGGEPEEGWRWGSGWAPERRACVSVNPSLLPTPRPLPGVASACRSASHRGAPGREEA